MPETPRVFSAARTPLRPEQYKQLQEAARVELATRGHGVADESLRASIDPFDVLTREQIEQLLAEFETKDQTSKRGA
jgi:hypothetical protein